MSNNYAGLDYSGPDSTVNRDALTGIRFGVISQHSIQPDVMSDIWQKSRDLSYEAAKEDILDRILASCASETQEERLVNIASDIEDWYRDPVCRSVAKEIEGLGGDSAPGRDEVWDVISDRFNDAYEPGDSHDWLWEKDGYRLENCLQSDVFVSRSPYFTYAQHCSPCCPGALNLDHPFEGLAVPQGNHASFAEDFKWNAEAAGFPACYCLGHDFFEGEKAPYEVFSVATGKRVVMAEKKEETEQ